jgi:iron complex outermembrane receptor protein
VSSKLVRFSVLALAGFSTAVSAQEEAAGISEIVVTARRVEERLQDAPVSIAAFSKETLERAAIQDIDDLANYTSNMTFNSGESGRLSAPILRGIGIIDTRGFDNSVGIFIDGVFVSGRATQNVGMLDLERVEVVKGPQSALYGRNTFAGAINYVTRQPSSEFSGRLEGTLGSDDLRRDLAVISGPLSERVSGRLALSYDDANGTYRNAGPLGAGDPLGGSEDKSVLATLRFEPNEKSAITLTGFYNDTFGQTRALSRVANNCGLFNPMAGSFTSIELNNPVYYCGEIAATAADSLSLSADSYAWDGETARGTLNVEYEFDRFSVQAIASFTDTSNLAKTDLDRTQAGEATYGYVPLATYQAFGSPTFICSGFVPVGPCAPSAMGATAPLYNQIRPTSLNTYLGGTGLDQTYWSTEVRFASPRDQRFRWLAGLFYFNAENRDTTKLALDASAASAASGLPPSQLRFLILDRGAFIPGLAPTGIALPNPVLPQSAFVNGSDLVTLTQFNTTDKQSAVFLSGEYDFTDRLTAIAELRYTHEKQNLVNEFDNFFFTPPSAFETSSSFVDPRLIVRYKHSKDLMIYGSAAQGSRSGGINPAIADPTLVAYEPEKNYTFEVGAKTSWFDNRLTFNAAVFYIDWKDAQFRQTAPGNTTVTATRNAEGGITSKGFELELAARLSNAWTANFSYGYSDPKFGGGTTSVGDRALCATISSATVAAIPISCIAGPSNILAPDIGGLQLRRTSKSTATLGIQYARPAFGDWSFVGRVDTSYRSKQYHDFLNVQYSPARTLANLRFGLESDEYDVVLWMENVTNEDSIESTQTFASDLNSRNLVTTAVNIPQRRYGLTARYRF